VPSSKYYPEVFMQKSLRCKDSRLGFGILILFGISLARKSAAEQLEVRHGAGVGFPRGTLFFELARLAEARKPSYLLFENVPYALLHINHVMSCKQLCKVSFRK